MEDIQKTYNICLCMVGSLVEAHLSGSMKDEEECDYDPMLIVDYSARGGDRENFRVGDNNSNMCKDVVIETELMQS